jgi:Methyltransferase domain
MAIASDPLGAFTRFQDRFAQLLEHESSDFRYDTNSDWEPRLHSILGVSWPCKMTSEFWALWPEVIEPLKAKGIRVGPESFGPWNDGDAGLVRAIWCLIRHLRPRKVVETGVARGMTSRFILEALEHNARDGFADGHLWSIDLPPIEPEWGGQIGMAVGDRFSGRWTYIKGSSRRRLPALLSQLGEIDLFIHDSLHSERNVRFEMDRAWEVLRPGGAIVVDDIDVNQGFRSFRETFLDHQSLVCEAEPLHPDLRRYNKKGLFGIILKEPLTASEPH